MGNPFKSELITDERYLINCLAYIQNNPVKARVVTNVEDYKYSSYINYITQGGIIDFDEAKKYYSTESSNIKAIMEELNDGNWLEHDDKIYEDKNEVFKELINKYGLTKTRLKEDDKLLKTVVKEMQQEVK
jgi:hypothetical protein